MTRKLRLPLWGLLAISLRRRLGEQRFQGGLKVIITALAFEERAARVNVPDDSTAIDEDGHRCPAAIVLVEPPPAQGSPAGIDRHRKGQAELADLFFHMGDA